MRRRDGGLLRHLRLVVLLGVTAAVLVAPSAFAATYTVDNTGDTDSLPCTGAAADCSLRSAITLSNADSGPADTINFDSTVFNGGGTSTISTTGSPTDIGISRTVNIAANNNCGPSAGVKPCVGVDKTAGNNTFEIGANNVSISGIAFTGAPGAAINGNGFLNLTVTGSWFGVALDGTTLAGNADGVSTGAGATGDVIGGTTAAARNVFAQNSGDAITTVNGGNNTIEGNYIGALPDGSAVANPGTTGILVAGQPTTPDTIGGDAANAGSCDGACNLIVNLSGDGIDIGTGGPGPTNTKVYGNFVGLGLNGTSDQGNGGSGISVLNALGTTIGANAGIKRNYIAANDGGGISTSQSNSVSVVNNYIGVNAAGTSSIKNTTTAVALGSGILFIGDGGMITNNHLGGNGITIIAQPNGGTSIQGNLIGVGPAGQAFNISGESGLELQGGTYQVGGTGAGEGNTIGNVTTVGDGGLGGPAAIFLSSSSSDTIQGNFVGTTSTGTPEPDAGWGILLGGSNGYTSDLIGGTGPDAENVISNSGHDAISFNQGGSGVRVLRNVGKNNGSGSNDLFFDINNPDGPGNANNGFSNNGIQAPGNLSATSTQLTGTGDDGDSIFVYSTYTGHGDIRASLGSTVVSGGTWSVTLPNLPAGQCVTANQFDNGSSESSEMAVGAAVGGGSCVVHPITEIATGPAEGTSTADPTPTFGFSSPDSGVVGFECRVDGDAFSSCSGGFTPSTDLADGTHSFTVHGLQAPSNPGLGPDAGTPVTRTFTVDTIPPTVSFTSGPGEGSSTTATSVSLGFTANESASFQCKVDSGSFGACTSPLNLSGLAIGSHSIQVRGTDAAGNVGAPASRSFTVQALPLAPPAAKKKCKKAKKGQASAAKKCKKKKK